MKKESSGSGSSSTSRADSADHRKRNKLPYDKWVLQCNPTFLMSALSKSQA